jgi:hypothetical protein
MSENPNFYERYRAEEARRSKEHEEKIAKWDRERAPTDPKEGWVVVNKKATKKVIHVTVTSAHNRSEDPDHDWFHTSDGSTYARTRIHATRRDALTELMHIYDKLHEMHSNNASKAGNMWEKVKRERNACTD